MQLATDIGAVVDKWGSGHAAFLSRGQRHAVELDATVARDGGEAPSRVTDLSLDGCCLTGDYRIGERVTVRIARLGEFPAQIRWALPGRAGARFERKAAEPAEKLAKNAKGVAAIEYALIAALIALVIVAAVTRTGTSVGNNWNDVDQAIPGGVNYQP